MALDYTPMTELEAVNYMLEMIGEQPVNDIASSGLSDAVLAQGSLHRVSRIVQSKGLQCNSDYKYPLVPDGSGYVVLPSNTLKLDTIYYFVDVVTRQGKLYNREKRTFVFTSTVYVDITFFLEYTDLPNHVREYIAVLAARRFLKSTVGDKEMEELTREDLSRTETEFARHELVKSGDSMLDTPGVYRVVNRRR